jgi:hypothetical protein
MLGISCYTSHWMAGVLILYPLCLVQHIWASPAFPAFRHSAGYAWATAVTWRTWWLNWGVFVRDWIPRGQGEHSSISINQNNRIPMLNRTSSRPGGRQQPGRGVQRVTPGGRFASPGGTRLAAAQCGVARRLHPALGGTMDWGVADGDAPAPGVARNAYAWGTGGSQWYRG